MVERQDPDNFPCFPTKEICAWKLAAYVFNILYFYIVRQPEHSVQLGQEWRGEYLI